MNDRLIYNRNIISKLSELVEEHPYLRFSQLLISCGVLEIGEYLCDGERQLIIKDSFYEEPEYTWNRMLANKLCFPDN